MVVYSTDLSKIRLKPWRASQKKDLYHFIDMRLLKTQGDTRCRRSRMFRRLRRKGCKGELETFHNGKILQVIQLDVQVVLKPSIVEINSTVVL